MRSWYPANDSKSPADMRFSADHATELLNKFCPSPQSVSSRQPLQNQKLTGSIGEDLRLSPVLSFSEEIKHNNHSSVLASLSERPAMGEFFRWRLPKHADSGHSGSRSRNQFYHSCAPTAVALTWALTAIDDGGQCLSGHSGSRSRVQSPWQPGSSSREEKLTNPKG